MKIDQIKNTVTWKWLARNPKFKEKFIEVVSKSRYFVELDDLSFNVNEQKLKVFYTSKIKNRDLDSQFKLFKEIEFSLDDDNNLIINELSGRLESNYGYSFDNTDGGKLNTYYLCQVFDEDGIELQFRSYGDRYYLDARAFNTYKNDLSNVVCDIYNPYLIEDIKNSEKYTHPKVIGNDSCFQKQMRLKDNLGIIEVLKCSFSKNRGVNDLKDEYYFNTFVGEKTTKNPELIHIMRGFPFATVDENNLLKLNDDYQKLGLTTNNYQDIARERFLKELMEEKDKSEKNQVILDKYEMMIEKMEKELGVKKNMR